MSRGEHGLGWDCVKTDNPKLSVSGIEKIVCDDIAKRQKMGINKYGTTVADNPLELKQWLQHLYEEMLDGAIYARRAIAQIEKEIE